MLSGGVSDTACQSLRLVNLLKIFFVNYFTSTLQTHFPDGKWQHLGPNLTTKTNTY